VETGTPVKEAIRKMGISEQTFYRWKKLYGGLSPSEIRRLIQLEEENRRLKQMVADLSPIVIPLVKSQPHLVELPLAFYLLGKPILAYMEYDGQSCVVCLLEPLYIYHIL
jgi:hypothetical protein